MAMQYNRIFNFSAGPSMLPVPVLERCRDEMLNYRGSGMSVMEMSHRSKVFDEIAVNAQRLLREVMGIPDHYKVLFMQGGASLQFAAIPLNLQQKRAGPITSALEIFQPAFKGSVQISEGEHCGHHRRQQF